MMILSMTGLEKKLHNICISAVASSLRWASCCPWATCSIYRYNLYSFCLDTVFFCGMACVCVCVGGGGGGGGQRGWKGGTSVLGLWGAIFKLFYIRNCAAMTVLTKGSCAASLLMFFYKNRVQTHCTPCSNCWATQSHLYINLFNSHMCINSHMYMYRLSTMYICINSHMYVY